MKFIGVSLYAFTLKTVQKMMMKEFNDDHWKQLTPSLNQIAAAAQTFCSLPYPLLQQRAQKIDAAGGRADFGLNRCFQLSYIKTLLSKVLGIGPDAHSIQFADSINGQDVDWPLGLYLTEAKLTHVEPTPEGSWFWLVVVCVALVVGTFAAYLKYTRSGVLYSALPNMEVQELSDIDLEAHANEKTL